MSENSLFRRIFLNDRIIVFVVIVNAIIIFLQESNVDFYIIDLLDMICTLFFLIEMIVKHIHFGFRNYWKSGMNCMDGILVLISLPSIVTFFLPVGLANLSFLLVLRIFRIFKFFRVVRLFPNFATIISNFRLALKQSYGIMLGFLILIVTVALLGCCMFRDAAPEFFGTPLDSVYSTFRFFTIEGWYEIPDAVASGMGSPIWVHVVRLYFCMLLLIGGIIGMSLINSIFVDAMVSDNNDDVKAQLCAMEKKLDEIMKQIESQKKEV